MRMYWAVVVKGERVSPRFVDKRLAEVWAESRYDMTKDDVQIIEWWD